MNAESLTGGNGDLNFNAIQQRNNEGWLRDLVLLEGSIGFTGHVVTMCASEYMVDVMMQAPRKGGGK